MVYNQKFEKSKHFQWLNRKICPIKKFEPNLQFSCVLDFYKFFILKLPKFEILCEYILEINICSIWKFEKFVNSVLRYYVTMYNLIGNIFRTAKFWPIWKTQNNLTLNFAEFEKYKKMNRKYFKTTHDYLMLHVPRQSVYVTYDPS